MTVTFKKQMEAADAARVAAATEAEKERVAKLADLATIADKLEKHLISQNPSEVGLNFEREGMRTKLQSRDYKIMIDPGFREYTGTVLVGFPAQTALGSRRGLNTLEDVDAYILGIVQSA
jgi:hypothetical protein